MTRLQQLEFFRKLFLKAINFLFPEIPEGDYEVCIKFYWNEELFPEADVEGYTEHYYEGTHWLVNRKDHGDITIYK